MGQLLPDIEDMHHTYTLYHYWLKVSTDKNKPQSLITCKQDKAADPAEYFPVSILVKALNDTLALIGAPFNTTDILIFDNPSDDKNGDSGDEAPKMLSVANISELVTKAISGAKEEEDLKSPIEIDILKTEKALTMLTDVEKHSLMHYSHKNTLIAHDKWKKIGTEKDDPHSSHKIITKIIAKVNKVATGDESAQVAIAQSTGANPVSNDDIDHSSTTTKILDHTSCPMPTPAEVADYLSLNLSNPTIFPEDSNRLTLLHHQILACTKMLMMEHTASAAKQAGKPSLCAGILVDDMGLGKTITVLSHVALTMKLSLQSPGDLYHHPALPSLVVIPPTVGLNWWNNYSCWFLNKLRIFFVGTSFHCGGNPFYQSCQISPDQFLQALHKPTKLSLYQNESDIAHTLFIISHHTFKNFTAKQTEAELDSSAVDIKAMEITIMCDELTSNKKILLKLKPAAPHSPEEDQDLVAEDKEFKMYILTFVSQIKNLVF